MCELEPGLEEAARSVGWLRYRMADMRQEELVKETTRQDLEGDFLSWRPRTRAAPKSESNQGGMSIVVDTVYICDE